MLPTSGFGVNVAAVEPNKAPSSAAANMSAVNRRAEIGGGQRMPMVDVSRLESGGTNDYHGHITYTVSNDALNARSFFQLPDFDTYRRNEGSAALSGHIPLLPNRLFFFVSYELGRGAESPAFSPVVVSQLPLLNQELTALGLPMENLHRFVTARSWDLPSGNLDFKVAKNDWLRLRYRFASAKDRHKLGMGPGGASELPSSALDISNREHYLNARYDWTISPSTVSLTAYTFHKYSASQIPASGREVTLIIPGLAVVGQSDLRAEGQSSEFHEGSEEILATRGKHTFNGNAKLSTYNGELQFAAFSAGRAIVPNLAALAAGSADLFEIGQGGSQVSYGLSALNLTLDDTYRVRPKVTLNGGIGYKAEFPPSFQKSDHGGSAQAGVVLDPRDGKTVLRAGYSLLRENYPTGPIEWELLVGADARSSVPAPARRVSSFVGSTAASTALMQLLTSGTVPKGPELAITNDVETRSPVWQTATASVEQKIMSPLTLTFSYAYSHRTGLLQVRNTNLPVPVVVNGRPDFGNRTLVPGFAQIYEHSNHGGRTFHGGTATANLRKNTYSLAATYTISKLIDDVLASSFENAAENAYNPRRDRAQSDFDTRQALDVVGNWDLPSFKQDLNKFRFINHITLLGDFHYNSGRYFNVLAGSDLNHDGNPLTDRPLTVGRNTFLGQEFVQLNLRLSSKFAFHEGMDVTFSVDCFNILNRANFNDFQTVLGQDDLTLVDPRIVFGRRGISDLTFRQPLTTNGFGLATSAVTPRRIQLGLKFSF